MGQGSFRGKYGLKVVSRVNQFRNFSENDGNRFKKMFIKLLSISITLGDVGHLEEGQLAQLYDHVLCKR